MTHDHSARAADRVNLKDVLGQVEADGRDLHRGGSKLVLRDSTTLALRRREREPSTPSAFGQCPKPAPMTDTGAKRNFGSDDAKRTHSMNESLRCSTIAAVKLPSTSFEREWPAWSCRLPQQGLRRPEVLNETSSVRPCAGDADPVLRPRPGAQTKG